MKRTREEISKTKGRLHQAARRARLLEPTCPPTHAQVKQFTEAEGPKVGLSPITIKLWIRNWRRELL